MSEEPEPYGPDAGNAAPPSHERILWIMAALGLFGGIAGFAFRSLEFGVGILLGTGLALVNYFWLKRSLGKIFGAAAAGERPSGLIATYLVRYVALAIVVAIVYVTGWLPIVAVIFGLGAFGFAVLVEGFIRLFSTFFRGKEI